MDATDVFRQGFAPYPPRHQQPASSRPRKAQRGGGGGGGGGGADDDGDGSSHRIAHTLTACCRCRQRKTRCDPTLPRCLPCERSNSICEYFDTTKNKKISRSYVVKLQEKVRQLESDLAQYTDDTEFPRNLSDIVRPGGLVRLDERDETPRYLGPSSGIAMTRLLMEEAKRFAQTTKISELIPDEFKARRAERANRMQSIVGLGSISGPSARRKSYPRLSAGPQLSLPNKAVIDKLVEAFTTRALVFTPVLHEQVFAKDLEEVCNGSTDPYKNFVVRMFLAISLQKLDTTYAGLADGYWQAAMQGFEEVVRPKDLKTLQCLVLIGEYSLLTPTRTNAYHIIGLAVRICQQLGFGEEKTIASGFSVDPLTLDMRRRLSWIVTTMEFGLAHSMGRPVGFAKGDDLMDVGFFADVDDSLITEQGIKPGPPSEKKLVAIHFCKMRVCQAEIRRTLYEKERHEPRDENDPWFKQMEQKIEAWLKAVPTEPQWCKPWFTGQYHTMLVFLNRPTPQIPKPSPNAANKCFESSAYLINLSSQQIKQSAVDITWVFLLMLYMSLNTVLWAVSYSDVRDAHPKKEVEELVNMALDIIDQCSERWPGSSAAAELYSTFAKACMQSYEMAEEPPSLLDNNYAPTPLTLASTDSPTPPDPSIPNAMGINQPGPPPMFNQGPFGTGYDFSAPPQQVANPFGFGDPFQGGQAHPQFRSNSIFMDPVSNDSGRRMSYYPPEATPPGDDSIPEEPTPPATTTPQALQQSPPIGPPVPSPHEALITPPNTSQTSLSPPISMPASGSSPTPTLSNASPMPPFSGNPSPNLVGVAKFDGGSAMPGLNRPQPTAQQIQQPQPQHQQRTVLPGAFTIPALPSQQTWPGAPPPQQQQQQQQQQHHHQQRPLPQGTTVTDWFNPPPPFISPYAAFAGISGGPPQPGSQQSASTNSIFADPSSTAFSGIGFGSGTLGASFDGGMTAHGAGGGGGGGGHHQMPFAGGGVNGMGGGPSGDGFGGAGAGAGGGFGGAGGPERQGSLSQEQQVELMGMLETEGLGEIDSFLNFGGDLGGLRW